MGRRCSRAHRGRPHQRPRSLSCDDRSRRCRSAVARHLAQQRGPRWADLVREGRMARRVNMSATARPSRLASRWGCHQSTHSAPVMSRWRDRKPQRQPPITSAASIVSNDFRKLIKVHLLGMPDRTAEDPTISVSIDAVRVAGRSPGDGAGSQFHLGLLALWQKVPPVAAGSTLSCRPRTCRRRRRCPCPSLS